MNKKWMPITAGILVIINGASGIILGLFGMTTGMGGFLGAWFHLDVIIWGVLAFVIGVLIIVGSVFILKRKKWPLAQATAIATIIIPIVFMVYGWRDIIKYFFLLITIPAIVAIILTILSKKQFE